MRTATIAYPRQNYTKFCPIELFEVKKEIKTADRKATFHAIT